MAWLVLLAVCVRPANILGQSQNPDSLTVDSGAFVRGQLLSNRSFVGTMVGPLGRHDSAAVCLSFGACGANPDFILRFRMTDLRQLDLRTRTRAREGAIAGGILGVTIGFLGYQLAKGLCEGSDCPSSPVPAVALGGAFFAVLGAMVGSGFTEWRTITPLRVPPN